MLRIIFLFITISMAMSVQAQIKNSPWLKKYLDKHASPFLQAVLQQPDTFRYQLIYTQINRDKQNRPTFKHYYLNVDKDRYFNPASTVKMPLAFLALEKLNNLQVSGLNKYSTMLTDSARPPQTAVTVDATAENGKPSIAHYIKKIFLVSDNDAYNRLYEFIGQQTINERLQQMGYTTMQITRRFVRMTEEENKYTNPVRFYNGQQPVYQQPEAFSHFKFDFSKQRLIGNAHYDRNDKLVNSPMDFTTHNNAPLQDLQQQLQAVLFPQSVSEKQRFNLTQDDYRFLYQYMGTLPSESDYPRYDTTEFFDSYTKFFFFRDKKSPVPDHIRSFNKTGWSYGFLTDICYIVDFKNNVEFMLSGNIYTNKDGVLNDDKYDYNETGYPFFKEVGEIIYQYELNRKRKYPPLLDDWKKVLNRK